MICRKLSSAVSIVSEWKPGDEPYYPVNDAKNGLLYQSIKKLADAENKVIFGGRLGEYKYYDMDQVIESMELARIIYRLTSRFPRDEVFGLTNQIRRAVVFISSNIAEGFGRGSDREFIHFLRIAKGSAAEVETQILISEDLHYVSPDAQTALSLCDEILRMLGTMIVKIGKRIGK